MADQTVIKFESNGPAQDGLVPWDDFPPGILIAGHGKQRGHEYFNKDSDALTAGVWDCTPCTLKPEPYSVDEFMVVLEGSIVLNSPSGESERYSAGEAFVIPRGLPCEWHQDEYCRKFYMIWDDPGGRQQADLPATAFRFGPNAQLPRVENQDPGAYLSEVPDMGHLTVYKDATGQFEAGIWECSPMQRKPATLARSELMHILEGSGTITNADGVVFEFSAGDTFLVPIGMGYQWHNTEYVKKFFCAFTPS